MRLVYERRKNGKSVAELQKYLSEYTGTKLLKCSHLQNQKERTDKRSHVLTAKRCDVSMCEGTSGYF